MPKTLVLELLQNGFEGCRAVNGAMRARLGAPQAILEAREAPLNGSAKACQRRSRDDATAQRAAGGRI